MEPGHTRAKAEAGPSLGPGPEQPRPPQQQQVVALPGPGQRVHVNKHPVQCHLCRQWFNNKDSNLIHQVIVHGLLHCKFCDKVFKSATEKKQHDTDKHNIFSCNQCKQNFSSHKLLIKHRAERHKLFACNFCDYNFTETDFQGHHIKTHRMMLESLPSLTPDIYYETEVDVIIPTDEKMKLKCRLCQKILKSSKMINHIKYFHNFSNFSLLECFKTTKLRYSLTDGSLVLVEGEAGAGAGDKLVVTGCSAPHEEYNCPICNVVYRDCGAHLLFQHNLRRCRSQWCEKYFQTEEARAEHEGAEHGRQFSCSVCSAAVSSQYRLVTHRFTQHAMQTCFFCDSIILTSLEPFANHLYNFHFIKNQAIIHNAKQFPVIFRLINMALVKFDPATKKVECCLCDVVKLDCQNGGEELVRHLVDFHRIKNPSRSLFSLFNGTEFHYHTMTNSPTDIVSSVARVSPQLPQPPRPPQPRNMVLVQRMRLSSVPRSILQQALSCGAKQIKLLTAQCIICKKADILYSPFILNIVKHCLHVWKKVFQSSEEVQRHLLSDHVTSSPSRVEAPSEAAEPVIVEVDPLAIKQEDAEVDPKQEDMETDVKPDVNVADSSTVEAKDAEVEIDEEHFSINNVEVKITEPENESFEPPSEMETEESQIIESAADDIVIKNELDYDENFTIVDFPESIEKETSPQSPPRQSTSKSPDKSEPKPPVSLKCEVCGVVMTSILTFTTHMRRYHKDSEQEKNKPYSCDICHQGFYFQSSLNSHKSKAHQETSGATFRCPLCPSVTNSKNGMRRHLRNSHKKTLLNEELSYKCAICGDLFWSIAERTVHIAETHKEASESLEKCHICGHISPNRHALRRHFQRMHPNEPLLDVAEYKCEECGSVFQQRSHLTAHVKLQHCPKSTMYQCSSCASQFTNKKSLNRHMLQHKKEEPKMDDVKYSCDVCQREFKTRKALKTHFSTSHNEKSKKGFVCKVCNKVLDSANDRSLHYKVDHPESNPYLCSVCGQGFITKNSLYNHRMCHKNSKIHKCDHCGKEFNRRDSFNEHLLIHVGPRHKCPHCPKEFVQKSNLKRHIRIHLGIKPYQCKFCEMTFSDKGACNSHQRTHTGEEREACPICNIVFSKKQKLKYHMRIHTGEGLETCHICNKIFTHTYALNVHMKIHSKENNFMCHHCKKIFQNASRLYKHIQIHSKKEYNCTECSKRFKFSKLLNRHVLAKHQNVLGLKCKFEQCEVRSNKLAEVREHVRQAHSVKNPGLGVHITDEYAETVAIDSSLLDREEPDLAAIYECLDEQIDFDVLRSTSDSGTADDEPEIKEELIEEEEEEYTTVRRKRRSSLVTKSMRHKKKDSSATQSLKILKRKRRVSGDKLIVRIRNKKEKIAAAAAALEDGADDDEEEAEDGDVIKSEPV